MSTIHAHAEIRLWGETVGAVVEGADGRVVFEYADTFAGRGIEISPIHLPLSRHGPQVFPELQRKEAFQGLPGVLADALPDSFGNQVIRAHFAARGEPERALSPVQRLLYIGDRAIGALTFHPSSALPIRAAEAESLAIAEMVRDARAILTGKSNVSIPEIYRIGSSAGGMRPKALVLFDPKTKRIRSGHATPTPGEQRCILKFDGVGDGATKNSLGRPMPFNRIEAAYAAMAREAGLDVVDIQMLEDGGHAHLMIRRFDREPGGAEERIHQHTLGGLLHVDYNEPGASSYEEYLRCILRLGMPQAAIDQAYRRIAFNVFAVNQDDHVKNLSFQLPQGGSWRLTPAYDLTFAKGNGFTARHQMRIADKTTAITRADLLGIAKTFGVKRAAHVLDEVRAAVSNFARHAAQTGVPAKAKRDVVAALAERAKEIGED